MDVFCNLSFIQDLFTFFYSRPIVVDLGGDKAHNGFLDLAPFFLINQSHWMSQSKFSPHLNTILANICQACWINSKKVWGHQQRVKAFSNEYYHPPTSSRIGAGLWNFVQNYPTGDRVATDWLCYWHFFPLLLWRRKHHYSKYIHSMGGWSCCPEQCTLLTMKSRTPLV